MNETEKEIIKRLSSALLKLDSNKKNYLLGMAEGMAITREEIADKKEN